MIEPRHKIHSDPDYINSQKYRFSVNKVLDDCPDGLTDKEIMKALMLSKKMFKRLYESALKKLRKSFE